MFRRVCVCVCVCVCLRPLLCTQGKSVWPVSVTAVKSSESFSNTAGHLPNGGLEMRGEEGREGGREEREDRRGEEERRGEREGGKRESRQKRRGERHEREKTGRMGDRWMEGWREVEERSEEEGSMTPA